MRDAVFGITIHRSFVFFPPPMSHRNHHETSRSLPCFVCVCLAQGYLAKAQVPASVEVHCLART